MTADWRALHRTLPVRVRFRLRWNRTVDGVAIWLAEHHRPGAAQALWRVFTVRGKP